MWEDLEYRHSGFDGASDLHLTGGSTDQVEDPDLSRYISAVGSVDIEWQDERSAQLRDIALVVIGMLLGLAGSCILDWIKLRPHSDA